MKKPIVAMVLFLAVLAGCASSGNQMLASESQETVSTKITQIIEGVTSKAEIWEKFGDPLETSFTDEGLETWTYELENNSADATNFVPSVNMYVSGPSDIRKQLVVLFDDNNIVKWYFLMTMIS